MIALYVIKVIQITSRQTLNTCPLLNGNKKKETDNLFTMTSGGFVIVVTNNSLDYSNGILLPKLFLPTVRKNSSSDQEKLLKFEAEG